MTDIRSRIREIEISYDYNHSTKDYDIVVNLTQLTDLFNKLVDERVNEIVNSKSTDTDTDCKPCLSTYTEQGYKVVTERSPILNKCYNSKCDNNNIDNTCMYDTYGYLQCKNRATGGVV